MAMKWTVILLACFVANITASCELGPGVEYDPVDLEGLWYIDYSYPDLFNYFYNDSDTYILNGDGYDVLSRTTFVNVGREETYKARFSINSNNSLTIHYYDLPEFDDIYIVAAVKADEYYFLKTCLPLISENGFILVMLPERCPTDSIVEKLTEVASQLGTNFGNYTEDPVVKKDCPPLNVE